MGSPRQTLDRKKLRLSDVVACVSTASRVVNGKRQGLTISHKLLIEFLAARVRYLIAIDHPFPHDPDASPLMETYSNGVLQSKSKMALPRGLNMGHRYFSYPFKTQLYYLFKLIDLVSSFLFVMRSKKVVDVYVGIEAVNVAAGLLLKKLGLVRFVVYYAFDFIPTRFPSSWANSVFLRLDRVCATHADVVWNAMPDIQLARDRIWRRKFLAEQVSIPLSISPPPDRRNYRPRSEHSIAYLGAIEPQFGVQVVISAMPEILEVVPDAEFHVVGQYQGNQFATGYLTQLSRELGVSHRVIFHGFLPDEEATEVLDRCRVGVAAYVHFASRSRLNFLDSSKSRYYAYHGLPVVISDAIPSSALLVEEYHAGLVVSPDVGSVAGAICSLMRDDQLYRRSLEGCYALVDSGSSERIYGEFFQDLLQRLPQASGSFRTSTAIGR